MGREFKLPDIGEGISEVELLQWYVQEGDVVREDQNLVEIETDKAVADLPSPYAGVVSRLHFQPGDRVPVGSVLVSFGEEGQTAAAPVQSPSETPIAERPMAAQHMGAESTPVATTETINGGPSSESRPDPGKGRVLAASAVRRRARELGVDLAAVQGG